jgi:LSD1 subclass zinc finger protein
MEEENVQESAQGASSETQKSAYHEKKISCSNCGAPLSYMEGEAVITCCYCGTTTMLAGLDNIIKVESHYMLSPELNAGSAGAALRKWMQKGFHKPKDLPAEARINDTNPLVLPYWIITARATTHWRGMNRKTRTTGTGDNKKTETYWEPVNGRFTEEFTWPVYAREKTSEFWGVDMLEPGKASVHPDWGKFWLRSGGGASSPNKNLLEGTVGFSIEKIKDSGMEKNLVNGQITQERAEGNARSRIVNRHAKTAESKATKLTDCDTTVEVEKADLVYLPLWLMSYSYSGKPYKALVNASSGDVIAAEYPVGKMARVVNFNIVFLLIAAIFAVLGSGEGGSWAWYIAGALGGTALLYTVLRIVKPLKL